MHHPIILKVIRRLISILLLIMYTPASIYAACYEMFPYSDAMFFALGQTLINSMTFWFWSILFLIVDKYDLMPQHKVPRSSANKYPDSALIHKAVRKLLESQIGGLVLFYFIYEPIVKSVFGMEVGLGDAWEEINATYIVFGMIFFVVVEDTLFYWAHRMLHHPSIYKVFDLISLMVSMYISSTMSFMLLLHCRVSMRILLKCFWLILFLL